jgi:hypothetical protein
MASNGVGRAAPERTFGTDRAEDCRVLGPGSEGPGAPSRSSRSLVIRTATQPSVTYPPRRVCAPHGSISSSRQQDHVRRIPRRGPVDIRVVEAHDVELVPQQNAADDRPHRQSPSCGKPAAYDKALRVERHDAMPALGLRKSPKPADGMFHLPTGLGLGLQINEAELAKRRVPIA